MKIRQLRRAAALALLAGAPRAVHAQDAPELSDSLPIYRHEALVVTGRRTPELLLNVPQRVDVVTRADAERGVGTDLAQLLVRNATVDVVQYPGLLSGVSIRGFRPQFSGINPRTLILIDGRPAGATNLSTIDLAGIERVELIRGPASALHGSGAMGGVVNVVTRRSSGELGGRATARYGSFASYRGTVAVGGTLARGLDFDADLAASGRGDGYRTGSRRTFGAGTLTKTLFGGATVQVPEVVGDTALDFAEYSTRAANLRLGYALGRRWRVQAGGGVFAGDDVQNPGDQNSAFPFPTLNDLDRRTGDVGLTGSLGAHDLSLRAYASGETTSYYDDAREPTFVSFRSPTRWYGAQLQDVVALGAHSLTAGIDYAAAEQRSEVFSGAGQRAAPYTPNSGTYSAAAFAEARLALLDDRLLATVGGRLDRVSFSVKRTELLTTSRAGSETTTVFNPSAGLLYHAGGGLRLHASGGRAFVTPSAFNVAAYVENRVGAAGNVTLTVGNPELEPENSTSWDAGVGLARAADGVELDVTYFHTDVRDRIVTRLIPAAGVERTPSGALIVSRTTYANADEAAIRGVEGRASYDLGAAAGARWSLRLFTSATHFLRAEETTGETTTDIKNVADWTAVFGAEYDDLRRFTTRLSGRYVGERLDTDFSDFSSVGDLRYPAFLVLDATASLRLGGRYRLGALLGNLTDENYYEVRGYNLPGRTLELELGVEF